MVRSGQWKKASANAAAGNTEPDAKSSRLIDVWTHRPSPGHRPCGPWQGRQGDRRKQADQRRPQPAAVRSDQPAAGSQWQIRLFSAKTTLALAQSLYERHKALTYPRTDSRALPEDYLPVVKQTFGMLADSGICGTWRRMRSPRLNKGYIKPSKRIFDNSKVSDHFAIIPTLQAPSGCRRPSRNSTTWWCGASWRCSSRAPNTWSPPA
jgi:DNA topoisomerase-3